jgi:general stress protein YciG
MQDTTPVEIASPVEQDTLPLQGMKRRGFASMSQERRREVAARGGKNAHAYGHAHKWTSEEARAAGRKGGRISRPRSKPLQ